MAGPRLSRRAWAIAFIALAIAGGAGGSIVTRESEPAYVATTTLLVGDPDRPDLAKSDFQASAMVAAIYGGIIRSEAVLGHVVTQLGLSTDWQELRGRVHVDVTGNEIPIISIIVYAGSPAAATATASAVTARMLELSHLGPFPQSWGDDLGSRAPTSEIQRAIARSEQRLSTLEKKARSTVLTSSERVHTELEIDRESSLLISWQGLFDADLSRSSVRTNDLLILQPAEVVGGKIRPHASINIGLGAAIGGLLAFAVLLGAAMRRRVSRDTRSVRDDVSPLTGLAPEDLSGPPALVLGTAKDPWATELEHPPQ